MDIATVIGILVGFGGVGWAMYEGAGGDMATFYSKEGFVLVFGGSIAAVCMSMPLRSILDVLDTSKNGFSVKNFLSTSFLKASSAMLKSPAAMECSRLKNHLKLKPIHSFEKDCS